MKKIHFIGIAGSAIAPLAVMMKELGWEVSGSDENVYEPALSLLNSYKIKWSEGYDVERVKDADLIILGGAPLIKNDENPEFAEAKRIGKQIEGYAYLLKEYVVKEKSIVVTGSYGKTTTSAMINWILEVAGKNPSFMIGGKPVNFDTGVRTTESEYSCLEGDEFVATFGFDMQPRFLHYKPKYAILSSTKWDHINVYPTEESYIEAFHKLANLVEQNQGKLYLCTSGENNEKVEAHYNGELITYMLEGLTSLISKDIDYLATNIIHNNDKTRFKVSYKSSDLGEFETEMIGNHNVENCLAAIALSHDLGIDLSKIKEGIATFKGIKRRQELRGQMSNGAIVIDDFAHSPVKAKATLEALRTRYKDNKIIAIYFPRLTSGEDRRTLDWYPGVFDLANEVIIPKIIVKKTTPKEQRIYGKEYVEAIQKTQPNAHYIPRDEDLIKFIRENSDQDTVVVFMSASGWRGLIEELIG